MAKFSFERIKYFEQFITAHHNAMTQPEMVKQLGVSHQTVTRLVNELGLKQRHYKKRNPRPALDHRGGMFNVNVHQDWLVGRQ